MDMKILVGPDDLTLKKENAKKKANKLAQVGNPVENPPLNNWSVNQPAPPHQHGLPGKADLGQNIIVDGHHVHYLQTDAKFATGMNGDEDLGQDIIMKGEKFHYK